MEMTLVNLAPLNFLFDASEYSPHQLRDAVKKRHVPIETNRTKDNKNEIRPIWKNAAVCEQPECKTSFHKGQ